MRRIIWSPRAQKDYARIIDYLLMHWTLKEIQKFVDQVEVVISILRKGNVEFRKTRYAKLHVAVISEHISVYYRVLPKAKVEIVRIWDNRQNPSMLIK